MYILSMGPVYTTCLHSGYSVYGSLLVTVLIGLSLKVNHTCTYARQVLLGLYIGVCSLPISFDSKRNPAYGSYMHPDSGHFFYLVWR